jgi:hypothetical protein
VGLSITNPAASNTTTVNPSKLVTKSNTAGEVSLGSGSQASPGASTWTQITASLAADSLFTKVTVDLSGGSFTLTSTQYFDIGIGAAASEVVKATVPLQANMTTATSSRSVIGYLTIPIRVAAGQRVAVRLSDGGLSGLTATYTLYGAVYTNVEGN